MRRLIYFVLALVMMLGACGRPNEDEASGKTVIRMAYLVSPSHSSHIVAEKFVEQVERESDGRLEVELYPSGSLFPSDREAVEAVQLGNVEMTIPALAVVSSFNQNFMVLDLPFLFDNHEEAYKVLDGEFGQNLLDDLKEDNLKGLVFAENGFRHITNNKGPIYEPSDLEGLKFRTLESPVQTDIFKAFGANASPFAFGEMYTALQQGTYDAMEGPISLYYTSNLYEVQDYMSLVGQYYMPTALLMNDDFYQGLPEDLQTVIMDASVMFREEQRELARQQDEEYLQVLKDEGVEVNEITEAQRQKFIEATEPVFEKYDRILGNDLIEELFEATEE
ncbi:DctP family TRAP transporter solute-binding subunit [Salinicoccus sp. ID82-1]|uniref:DctP family TRAP transporter solute-binding subunit n=1 Tax=Salinicoccus cyprini TaxID=2493691 RepID=A0A558AYU0_9STAP|nr:MULTISPECIES: DctP family TRAP transporter solute-binding subunit [Salinicoccus]MCG1008963.1 DctP family TRAP transporter solute-binding subunit [Salinicoccus sp. ID82-1]TVT29417.1 DctP family TRAP transporter solute-binding subunit [Salinicoccus cyprini]